MIETGGYQKFLRRAELFDYGTFQGQFRSLLEDLKAGRPPSPEKYSQLSPEAIKFLTENPNLPEGELSIICFYLFTSAKPGDQRSIIEKIKK